MVDGFALTIFRSDPKIHCYPQAGATSQDCSEQGSLFDWLLPGFETEEGCLAADWPLVVQKDFLFLGHISISPSLPFFNIQEKIRRRGPKCLEGQMKTPQNREGWWLCLS